MLCSVTALSLFIYYLLEEPTNIESTMNSTQVVNENMLSEVELRLADLIDQRVSAIEVKLCSEYENKMAEITTAYNRKIEDLELKLSTAITAEAKATVRTVSSFSENHETRFTQFVSDTNMKFDVLEKQHINAFIEDIATIKQDISQFTRSPAPTQTGVNLANAEESTFSLCDVHTMAATNKSAIAEIQCILDNNPAIKSNFINVATNQPPKVQNTSENIPAKSSVQGGNWKKKMVEDVEDLKRSLNSLTLDTSDINERINQSNIAKYY